MINAKQAKEKTNIQVAFNSEVIITILNDKIQNAIEEGKNIAEIDNEIPFIRSKVEDYYLELGYKIKFTGPYITIFW